MTTWNKTLHIRYPITKIYPYYKNNGFSEILAVSQKQLHKVSGGVLTVVPGSLANPNAKFLAYKDRSMNDVVLIADKGKLKAYNGTNVSEVTPKVPNEQEAGNPGLNDLTNLTNFRSFAMKKDRIFVAAHPTVRNRVSFSYIDPYVGFSVYDYFPASYFFDVGVEDNDEIVELRVFRDALIIFCKRSIWALYGDGLSVTDYELVKINVPKGCISPDSIQEVGNNLFYLAEDQVYSLFSTERNYISAKVVSDPVAPLLKPIGVSDKEKATAIFHENKYLLSFPSGLTLVYDITLDAWTRYTNIAANSFMTLGGELYFCSNRGFIYRFSDTKYSDDGRPINFSMKTKIIDFDRPIHHKKVRRMWVLRKQWSGYESSYQMRTTIDQFTTTDLEYPGEELEPSSGALWDAGFWDEVVFDMAEVSQNEWKFKQKAKSLQVKICNNEVNEPLTIYGIVFEYKLKRP